MNILILGGNGFIGFEAAHTLVAAGHAVTAIGRNLDAARQRLPSVNWVKTDLASMTAAADWAPLLQQTDVVVNCAGALQDSPRDDLAAVQDRSMRALYEAARGQGKAPLVIQISANTSGSGADLPFMATKRAADGALKSSGLPHVILRPALVIGRNAHGGSALVRALAAFPLVTPLLNRDSRFQTVALDEVVQAIVLAVEGKIAPGSDVDLANGDTLTLEQLIASHRIWLGLAPQRSIVPPRWLSALAARCADVAAWFGWRSPMRSTAVDITFGGVLARPESEQEGTAPIRFKSLQETLSGNPAGAQDLWFARLYLLKPGIVLILALFWTASGAIALFKAPMASSYLEAAGFSPDAASVFTLATALLDVVLGFAVLFRRFAKPAMTGMILVSLAYLAVATVFLPTLWTDPLGPLVKVLPSVMLTLAGLAILDER